VVAQGDHEKSPSIQVVTLCQVSTAQSV
jgi:hypothetical protein